jgi:LysM repeat protein
MRPKALIFALGLSAALHGQGQPPPADAEMPLVARPEKNVIQRPLELGFFFRRLRALERRKPQDPPQRVTILEIGDSHLQGDQFSHPLRMALERRFGLAGRGLVFPYSVAHSSNSWDLISQSNVKWVHRRSAVGPPTGFEDLDSGIAGFSVMTQDPGYILRVGLNSQDLRFDTLSIFSRRDADAFGMLVSTHPDPGVLEHQNLMPQDRLHEVEPGDTLSSLAKRYGVRLAELRDWNHIKNDQIFAGDALIVKKEEESPVKRPISGFADQARMSGGASADLSFTVRLRQPVTDVFLRGFKDAPQEKEAVLYGLSLERSGSSGVFYHAAGVNGAQLKSFARSPRFIAQARCLDPDLVVIALGTNEAMSEDLATKDIEDSLLTLLSGFTKGNPKYVAFLIVTPPDVLNWHGGLNNNVAAVAAQLRDFASRHGLALWDWQQVMGGPGSVLSWREARLVGSDGVHMNAAGYDLQSRLFYRALMDAYERY